MQFYLFQLRKMNPPRHRSQQPWRGRHAKLIQDQVLTHPETKAFSRMALNVAYNLVQYTMDQNTEEGGKMVSKVFLQQIVRGVKCLNCERVKTLYGEGQDLVGSVTGTGRLVTTRQQHMPQEDAASSATSSSFTRLTLAP